MRLETKDAAPTPAEEGNVARVIEEMKGHLEGIATYKEKFTELEQSLAEFRKNLEDAVKEGKEGSGEALIKLDSYKTEIVTRLEDMEGKANGRLDSVETRLNRSPMGLGGSEEEAKEFADAAREFKLCGIVYRGGKVEDPDAIEGDLEGYKAYSLAMKKFLRRGEKGLTHDVELKALSEGSDADGGYFVRPEISNRIIKKIYESSPIRSLATVETTGSGEIDILVDNDEPDAGWVSETGARSTTGTPTIGKKTLIAHEMYAAPKATTKLLEDSSINVEAWLADKVATKFARVEATAFVNGNGVGRPRGFLTYAAGTAWGQIEQILAGVSGGFKYIDAVGGSEGLVNIMGALKERYHANATWVTNRGGFVNLLSVADGDGRYIFAPQMIQGTRQAFIPTLLGFPLRMAADMDTLAADSLSIAFGDFREAYTIIDKLGTTLQRDPYTKKPYVEFYTRKRVGGDVVNYEALKIGKCNT